MRVEKGRPTRGKDQDGERLGRCLTTTSPKGAEGSQLSPLGAVLWPRQIERREHLTESQAGPLPAVLSLQALWV